MGEQVRSDPFTRRLRAPEEGTSGPLGRVKVQMFNCQQSDWTRTTSSSVDSSKNSSVETQSTGLRINDQADGNRDRLEPGHVSCPSHAGHAGYTTD